MRNKKAALFLGIVILLALFLRFYKLTDIPNGFNQDESAIGYNAYSILKTGKDEYGKTFPLYFKSFGDQKLPVYIYMTVVTEKLFGLNKFAVRFPSALFGTLAVLMLYLLINELSANKKLAFLSALFLAINPWSLFLSRAAFEDNVGLTFAIFAVWSFLSATRSKKWIVYFLSMLGFALSLYSYNVTRLLAPALLASLVFIHWKSVKQVPKIIMSLVILFLLILLTPFLITIFSPAGAASAHGALITSTDIQAKGIEMRSYLVGPANIIAKIFFNKYIFLIWQYLQNLIAALSVTFLFISGSAHGSQGIGNMGTFYLIECPIIITGIVLVIKNKIKTLYFIVVWAIIAILVLALSKEVPHETRGYFIVIPSEVFSALGLLSVLEKLQKIKKVQVRYVAYLCIFAVSIYNLVFYFSSYYFRFPLLYASGWRQQDQALSEFIKQNEKSSNKVIIDTNTGFIYTSLLFFTAYPPEEFQQTVKRLPDDSEGFSTVQSFGKYEWKDTLWNIDGNDTRHLIILTQRKVPSKLKPLAVFSYPQIPIVLSVKEKIAQYPQQEVVYVAVKPTPIPVLLKP